MGDHLILPPNSPLDMYSTEVGKKTEPCGMLLEASIMTSFHLLTIFGLFYQYQNNITKFMLQLVLTVFDLLVQILNLIFQTRNPSQWKF